MTHVTISDQLKIPQSEFRFEASRSSGPGGQHVNTSATRVTISLDVGASPSLDDEQRELIRDRLSHRISKAGLLSISSQGMRSQLANRRAATERLVELLQEALQVPTERRPTRVPRGVHRRRLTNKRHRSKLKTTRGRLRDDTQD